MNKKLVTSLELSRTLEKLGVKQESEFYWVHVEGCKEDDWVIQSKDNIHSKADIVYSAFLSGELGEMLKKIDIDCWYSYPDFRLKLARHNTSDARDEREAEARGKMLVYLKENKLI